MYLFVYRQFLLTSYVKLFYHNYIQLLLKEGEKFAINLPFPPFSECVYLLEQVVLVIYISYKVEIVETGSEFMEDGSCIYNLK